jgi:sirohydrochlorin ferrochelatase
MAKLTTTGKAAGDRTMTTTALLLIAHGSRQSEANADLETIAAELRKRHGGPVVTSFLELAQPDIESAARQCVEQGAAHVILLPYFLSAGVHVQRDLEAHRQRLGEKYPHVDFSLAAPLGPHPLLVDILLQRALALDISPLPESN